MIAIENHIPVPDTTLTAATRTKLPFRQMEVGDSFLVPLQEGDEINKLVSRVRASTKSASARLGFKFVLAIEDGGQGVRVWRSE